MSRGAQHGPCPCLPARHGQRWFPAHRLPVRAAASRTHRATRRRARARGAGARRDVFNEKPNADDALAEGGGEGEERAVLPRGAVLHTSRGDITLRLFPDEARAAPRRVVLRGLSWWSGCQGGRARSACQDAALYAARALRALGEAMRRRRAGSALPDVMAQARGRRAQCPRTVENFTTHARNGYYDNVIFHRVIKGFMVQTGDPLGAPLCAPGRGPSAGLVHCGRRPVLRGLARSWRTMVAVELHYGRAASGAARARARSTAHPFWLQHVCATAPAGPRTAACGACAPVGAARRRAAGSTRTQSRRER